MPFPSRFSFSSPSLPFPNEIRFHPRLVLFIPLDLRPHKKLCHCKISSCILAYLNSHAHAIANIAHRTIILQFSRRPFHMTKRIPDALDYQATWKSVPVFFDIYSAERVMNRESIRGTSASRVSTRKTTFVRLWQSLFTSDHTRRRGESREQEKSEGKGWKKTWCATQGNSIQKDCDQHPR